MPNQSIMIDTTKAMAVLETKAQAVLRRAMTPHMGQLSAAQEEVARVSESFTTAKLLLDSASDTVSSLELARKDSTSESMQGLLDKSLEQGRIAKQHAQEALDKADAAEDVAVDRLVAVKAPFKLELDLFYYIEVLKRTVEQDEERINNTISSAHASGYAEGYKTRQKELDEASGANDP